MKRKFFTALILLIILIVGATIVFINLNQAKTINITQAETSSTIGWKEYKNTQYRFSFLYPEGELSDFHEEPLGMRTKKSIDDIIRNSDNKKTDPNVYNVKFSADAWRYDGTIDEFLKKKHILNTQNATKSPIMIGPYEGLRVTNVHLDDKVYYQYNFFTNNGFIYSFNLFSDDPVLIQGNQKLLDTIISTAKFY